MSRKFEFHDRKLRMVLAGIFLGLSCLALPLFYAQADEVSDLKDKIQAVQDENQSLRQKLGSQDALIQELAKRLSKLEAKETVPLVAKTDTSLLSGLSGIPKMQVKGFSNVTLTGQKADDRGDANPSTFTMGQLDFMITSQLAKDISFFNENVVEFGATTEIDTERLYVKYTPSRLFNVMVGRYHTPFGYWNKTFHHGTWFQTTIGRPLAMEFEDDGGVMPMHSVGVNFFGTKDMGSFDFDYEIGVSNGRASTLDKVQNMQDGNDAKALNSLLSVKPHSIPGLAFGLNTYLDKIPADNSAGAPANRAGEIGELTLGGYIAYVKNKIEFLCEGFNIKHQDDLSEEDYTTTALYLQAAYKVKDRWTPYYRFDLLDFGRGNPYWAGADNDNKKHTVGVRWDISTWNALKAEYSYSNRKNITDQHNFMLDDSFHF